LPTRYFATSDGTRLAWDELGSGPTVLFVHGIGSSRKRWEPQHEALSGAGFRSVRLDLRGFGESEGGDQPFGMPTFLDDLTSFSAGLGAAFHLVGHSLGGMIAQKYVVDQAPRVRSLVLASTTSHNGRRATAFARVMTLLSERGFDLAIADAACRPEIDRALAEAFPGGMPLEMLRTGLEQPSLPRANAWRACVDYSVKDRLSELRCPVLVTHGTADPLIPFRAGELVHQAIPHSTFVVEEGAGHSLPRERAESFNARLLEFLRRAESAATS
jgi:pimeloyl-ACP methyl ester carboxylesterase